MPVNVRRARLCDDIGYGCSLTYTFDTHQWIRPRVQTCCIQFPKHRGPNTRLFRSFGFQGWSGYLSKGRLDNWVIWMIGSCIHPSNNSWVFKRLPMYFISLPPNLVKKSNLPNTISPEGKHPIQPLWMIPVNTYVHTLVVSLPKALPTLYHVRAVSMSLSSVLLIISALASRHFWWWVQQLFSSCCIVISAWSSITRIHGLLSRFSLFWSWSPVKCGIKSVTLPMSCLVLTEKWTLLQEGKLHLLDHFDMSLTHHGIVSSNNLDWSRVS